MNLVLKVRDLGLCPYKESLRQMQAFTLARNSDTLDELWLLEHLPVFTQGQAGKTEHILDPSLEVIASDRGGQITYHAPGQLIVYILADLKRLNLDISGLKTALEQAVILLLNTYGIEAYSDPKAPGVYTTLGKIASLALRIKRFASYHGLSLNIDLDLSPFKKINPCGYKDLAVTRLIDHLSIYSLNLITEIKLKLSEILAKQLAYRQILWE